MINKLKDANLVNQTFQKEDERLIVENLQVSNFFFSLILSFTNQTKNNPIWFVQNNPDKIFPVILLSSYLGGKLFNSKG